MDRYAKNRDLIGVGRRPEGERPTISSISTLLAIKEAEKKFNEELKRLSLKTTLTKWTKKSKNKA